MRLLSVAAAAAGAGGRPRSGAGIGDGARGRLFGRARYRDGIQFSQQAWRVGAADVRRGGSAIYADRRLGAGDRLLSDGARRCVVPRRDGGGAGRRCVGGEQRLLVGADDRDDAKAADAVLHRGQWLRHFGAVELPDSRGRYSRQPRELAGPGDFRRRRDRPGRGGEAGRGSDGACAGRAGAGTAAADGAAASGA